MDPEPASRALLGEVPSFLSFFFFWCRFLIFYVIFLMQMMSSMMRAFNHFVRGAH